MSAALNILFNLSARVRHELSSEVKKQGFVLRVNFSEQNSTDFFVFFFYPLENSCTSTPPLPPLPMVSVSTCLSVWARQWGYERRLPCWGPRVPGGANGAEKRISIKRL